MTSQQDGDQFVGGVNGQETGEKPASVQVGVSVQGLFSSNPQVKLNIPVSTQTRQIGREAHSILSDLSRVTNSIREMDIGTKMSAFLGRMSDLATQFSTGASHLADSFTSIELFFELTTGMGSLVNMITSTLTPMSILGGLYSVFRMIRAIVFKLPVALATAFRCFGFGTHPNDTVGDVYYDCVAEGGSSLINLAYSGLIMLLPKSIRDVLEAFQRYTRVKILEDLDWVLHIADIVLHVPTFIMTWTKSAFVAIGADWSDKVVGWLDDGIESFERVLSFLPELRTYRLVNSMTTICNELREDRRLLSRPDIRTRLDTVYDEATAHMLWLRETRNQVPNNLDALYKEVKALRTASAYLMQKSHPEPVAVLLWSQPGQGKTVFLQRLREYLSADGKNTFYDYAPTDSRADFHDQYNDQDIWTHEDIGQRGPQDWAQYILHIGTNPSRMDGAALEKKSTIFFRSKVVLGTTNIAIHRTRLMPTRDCGWTDVHALNRRWLVVEYTRDNPACAAFLYDVGRQEWRKQTFSVNCQSPAEFAKTLRDRYVQNVDNFKRLIKNTTDGAVDFSFNDLYSEGRVRDVVLQQPQAVEEKIDVDVVDIPDLDHPRMERVHFDSHIETVSFNTAAQQAYLADGKLINGGTEPVGCGDVHVGTQEGWMAYLRAKYSETSTRILSLMSEASDALRAAYDVLTFHIPREYIISAAVISSLGLFATLAITMYYSTRKVDTPDDMKHFVAWAKPNRRLSAKQLFAEGRRVDLNFLTPPSAAVVAVQKNILRAVFSYGVTNSFGYIVMIDHDTALTTSHLLLVEGKQPDRVFIRAEDSNDSEVVSAFFTPVCWDLKEDLVVMKYTNPHQHRFRALKHAMNKEPSSKEMYIITPEGSLSIGVPNRSEVTSGMYRTTYHRFEMDRAFPHNYDGVARNAPGLCGALAVTKDGYILGWHVAGNNDGVGYVRFWNEATRAMVLGGLDSLTMVDVRDTDIKGATIVDTDEYHHVHLSSSIRPSRMLEELERSPVLCPTGHIERAPAALGGRVPDDPSISTYDQSRKKNLIKAPGALNMKALSFARGYITYLLDNIMDGEKLTPLSDIEMVCGYTKGDEHMPALNTDASAGVPLGGLVGDWADKKTGKMHPRLEKMVSDLHKTCRRGVKHFRDVMFKDCNKDEVRDAEKIHKPRCFAAGPLHYNLLLRKYIGRLNAKLMKYRHRTGIMMGINATSREWQRMWSSLCVFPNHFDGDYKNWDGMMVREMQEELIEVLASMCSDKEALSTILMFLAETTHVGYDMTYITTHSAPSGHSFTTGLNSLINKMYIAYAWYLLVGYRYENKLSPLALYKTMDSQVQSKIFGDDIVVAVSSAAAGMFNAQTYAMIMRDLGVGFTAANKQEHTTPFIPLRDITFLKRSFQAHRLLNEITGPLDLKVLRNTLAYVNDPSRDIEISHQKMDCVQRELFLHPHEVYTSVWSELKVAYEAAFGLPYEELTETELMKLYKRGDLRCDMFDISGACAESDTTAVLPSRRRYRTKCKW